jgi:uncharacterized paraquat-inducible protein A
MKNVGLLMIYIGIVIFIASILTGVTIDPVNPKYVIYLEWLMGLGQILVISGIGFILYDIAAKHHGKGSPVIKEKQRKEQTKAKEAILDCPNCNQKNKFPFSMVGSVVECPNCQTKVKIEAVQEQTGKEDFKWD